MLSKLTCFKELSNYCRIKLIIIFLISSDGILKMYNIKPPHQYIIRLLVKNIFHIVHLRNVNRFKYLCYILNKFKIEHNSKCFKDLILKMF